MAPAKGKRYGIPDICVLAGPSTGETTNTVPAADEIPSAPTSDVGKNEAWAKRTGGILCGECGEFWASVSVSVLSFPPPNVLLTHTRFSDSMYYTQDGTLQVLMEARLEQPTVDAGCVIC